VKPEGIGARPETVLPFKREIDHLTSMHAASAVFPAEGDVHHHREDPERLAALRRAPQDNQAGAWDDAFDQIFGHRRAGELVERNEIEAPAALIHAVGLVSPQDLVNLGIDWPHRPPPSSERRARQAD